MLKRFRAMPFLGSMRLVGFNLWDAFYLRLRLLPQEITSIFLYIKVLQSDFVETAECQMVARDVASRDSSAGAG